MGVLGCGKQESMQDIGGGWAGDVQRHPSPPGTRSDDGAPAVPAGEKGAIRVTVLLLLVPS
jgi:hypothetical protein